MAANDFRCIKALRIPRKQRLAPVDIGASLTLIGGRAAVQQLPELQFIQFLCHGKFIIDYVVLMGWNQDVDRNEERHWSEVSPRVMFSVEQITQLKIDNNPFAKGFRDTGNGRREKRSGSGMTEWSVLKGNKGGAECMHEWMTVRMNQWKKHIFPIRKPVTLQFKAREAEQRKDSGCSDDSSSDRPGHFLHVPTVAASTPKGFKALPLPLPLPLLAVTVLVNWLNPYT